jgi:GNAT superfamily N-acetyltransferase
LALNRVLRASRPAGRQLSADTLGDMAEIRPAKISDLEIVVSWVRSDVDSILWAGPRVSYPIDLASLPKAIEWKSSDAWTLESGGGVVAFGQLLPKPNRRVHLARLIAAPRHRGRGLGRLIATHLLKTALSRHPSAISLYVAPENFPAVELYLSLGFAETARPVDDISAEILYMEHVA